MKSRIGKLANWRSRPNSYLPSPGIGANLKQLETNLKHFFCCNLLFFSPFQSPAFPNLKHSRISRGQYHAAPAQRNRTTMRTFIKAILQYPDTPKLQYWHSVAAGLEFQSTATRHAFHVFPDISTYFFNSLGAPTSRRLAGKCRLS